MQVMPSLSGSISSRSAIVEVDRSFRSHLGSQVPLIRSRSLPCRYRRPPSFLTRLSATYHSTADASTTVKVDCRGGHGGFFVTPSVGFHTSLLPSTYPSPDPSSNPSLCSIIIIITTSITESVIISVTKPIIIPFAKSILESITVSTYETRQTTTTTKSYQPASKSSRFDVSYTTKPTSPTHAQPDSSQITTFNIFYQRQPSRLSADNSCTTSPAVFPRAPSKPTTHHRTSSSQPGQDHQALMLTIDRLHSVCSGHGVLGLHLRRYATPCLMKAIGDDDDEEGDTSPRASQIVETLAVWSIKETWDRAGECCD